MRWRHTPLSKTNFYAKIRATSQPISTSNLSRGIRARFDSSFRSEGAREGGRENWSARLTGGTVSDAYYA